jgi:hypothetical protein
LGLIALAFLLGCNELADYDIWWHLRTGQLIPERGVPETDWYSFTSSERPWIDVHWGFQLMVASVYRWGGIPGLVLMKAVLAALTMSVALLSYRRAWPVWPQFLVMLVALVVMSNRFYVRPEMFTLLFTSVFLAVLMHAEERPPILWILPAIQIVWANVQGLFVFGPILVGMHLTEALARGRSYRGNHRLLLLVAGLVAGVCIVSPYGVRNVLFLGDLWQKIDPSTGDFYRATIGELMDVPTFVAQGGWRSGHLWFAGLLAMFSAAGMAAQWRGIVLRREWMRILPVVAFLFLAWQAVRNWSHFALVVGVVTSANFGSILKRPSRTPWLSLASIAVTGGLALAFVSGVYSEGMGSHRRLGLGAMANQYSFEGMKIFAREGMPTKGAVFHLGHAATYIFAAGPERKILMDPRLEVHSEEMLRTYREIQGELETGRGTSLLDGLGVDLVAADGEQNIGVQATLLASPFWQCVHWDPVIAIFVRANHPIPAGVERYDFLRGFWADVDGRQITGEGTNHEAGRLASLGQMLQQRSSPILLRDRVLWRALRKADGSTTLAQAMLLLADRYERPAGTPIEDAAAGDVLRSSASSLMTRMKNLHRRSWSAYFLHQEFLARHGDLEGSCAFLTEMRRWPADGSARQQFRTEIDRLLADRRRQLDTSKAPKIRTFADALEAKKAGRLHEVAAQVTPALMKDWTDANRRELGRWMILAGRLPPGGVDGQDDQLVALSAGALAIDGPDAASEPAVSDVLRAWQRALDAVVRGSSVSLCEMIAWADAQPEPASEGVKELRRLRETLLDETNDR